MLQFIDAEAAYAFVHYRLGSLALLANVYARLFLSLSRQPALKNAPQAADDSRLFSAHPLVVELGKQFMASDSNDALLHYLDHINAPQVSGMMLINLYSREI